MKVYTLEREQFLPVSLQEAWSFFSSPANLSEITPKDMGFTVLSQVPAEIYKGLLIEYRVAPLLGISMKWVTKIGDVQPPFLFVDTQLKGPYALWEHTHIFKEQDGGVMMTDTVRYSVPLGILGRLANSIFVRKRLEQIFDFRYSTLENYFKK